MNYQDMSVVIPGTRVIGMSGSISPRHMWRITNDYLLAFFGRYLSGEQAPLLANPSYPEVRVQSYGVSQE